MCPSEAPPATRGRSRPPNTLALVRLGREAAEQQVFPAPGCHPRPAGPTGDVLLHPSSPASPRDLPPLGDTQAPLSLGRQVALLQRDTSSSTHTPAVHILLEKISLLLFQVPAKMRLKNVQNAGFASFPLCVSVCSANRALPQSSALALTFGNKREAFILIGKQDYKLAVKL